MSYLVLYRTKWDPPIQAPSGFLSDAPTVDEAEAHCEAAIPGASAVWVCQNLTYQQALDDYYNQHLLAG